MRVCVKVIMFSSVGNASCIQGTRKIHNPKYTSTRVNASCQEKGFYTDINIARDSSCTAKSCNGDWWHEGERIAALLYPNRVFLSETSCMSWSRCEVCDHVCTMIPDRNFGSKFCLSFLSYFMKVCLHWTCLIFVCISMGRKIDFGFQHR